MVSEKWQELRLPSRPFELQQLRSLNREIECKEDLTVIELITWKEFRLLSRPFELQQGI